MQLGANMQFINFECKWSSCQFRNFGKASPFSRSLLTFRTQVNISLFLLFESYVFSFPLGANASLPGFSCGETNSCWSLGCQINICYLPAGRSVWWKTVTEVLKILPEAVGRGQHFQDRGHSFSPYGQTPSR